MHSHLGRGSLGPVDQAALAVELTVRGIPFHREAELPVHWQGRILECGYEADLVCVETRVVGLKVISELPAVERAQANNDLRAAALSVALLLNVADSKLEHRRIVLFSHAR